MLSSLPSTPICFGNEVAYIAIPSLVCLAPIGANGVKCCVNPLKCAFTLHKHPHDLDESNPFLKKSDTTTDSTAVSNPRGHSQVKLAVN